MQEVNGYPLPNTGCVVQVHSSGNVVNFHYNGQKAIEKKPSWPSDIVEENVVLESLKARQDMRLVFVDLTHSSCEYENGEEVKGTVLYMNQIQVMRLLMQVQVKTCLDQIIINCLQL